ncbi:hypothetical protein M422DRAFT_201818 [Sphaerobolus stellatus SS14]|nr:hypothetical protein M422DRAFT_201818 [Sphaerobolus stellatus SS14]
MIYTFETTPLEGSCFCGAVTFKVIPPALLKGYCHCSNCQRFTGSPFLHTVHFPESSFQWTHVDPLNSNDHPLTQLDTYTYEVPGKATKIRYRCKTCGVTVANHNKDKKKITFPGTLFPRDEDKKIRDDVWELIKPDNHIFYGTRRIEIDDDLGKWEGYPDVSKRLG